MKTIFTKSACLFWALLLITVFSGSGVHAQSEVKRINFNKTESGLQFNTLSVSTVSFGIETKGNENEGWAEIVADPGIGKGTYLGVFYFTPTLQYKKDKYYSISVDALAGTKTGQGASQGDLLFVMGENATDLEIASTANTLAKHTVVSTTAGGYAPYNAIIKANSFSTTTKQLYVGLKFVGIESADKVNKAKMSVDNFVIIENNCPPMAAPVPTATSVTRCDIGNVTLSVNANSDPNIVNRWYSGTTLVYTGNNYPLTLSDYNLKTFTVEAYNTVTGCVSTNKATVTAKANPIPNAPTIPATATNSRCGTGTVNLQVTGAPAGGSYLWYNAQTGGTAISGATSSSYTTPSMTVTSTAVTSTYYVSAVSAEGCESSTRTQVTATAYPMPVATITVNGPESYCPATTASKTNLSVGTSTGYTYQWYKDDVAISGATNFNHTPTSTGQFYVIVTNTNGCSTQSASKIIELQPIQTSNGSIDLVGQTDVEPGKPATYVVTSQMQSRGDAESFKWFMISDSGTTPLGSTTDQLYIASVPDYQYTLRCEVTPKSGTCYDPTPLRVESTQITPLPVEIIYFNAARQGNNVLLEWATASEHNNTGFEVQVSQDGFNFRKMGFVTTQNGNTAVKQNYTFTDKENGKYGTRYYRLKQIDMDGTFEYFTTKAVSFGAVSSYSLKAFPNPFESEVSLELTTEQAGNLNVQVLDAMGRSVLTEQFAVSKGHSVEKITLWQSLPKGIYFVRTEMNGIANNFKLLKK